jgi:hypothetical protein
MRQPEWAGVRGHMRELYPKKQREPRAGGSRGVLEGGEAELVLRVTSEDNRRSSVLPASLGRLHADRSSASTT